MRGGDIHFSSETCVWATPQELFDCLNREFLFDVDVCALPENAKCSVYFTPETDGLSQEWVGNIWCNPPYGEGIGEWVKKGCASVRQRANTVVLLIPARTDTAWWHDYAMRASEVRLIRGRLKFGNAEANAPFPSALIIFQKDHTGSPVFLAADCYGRAINNDASPVIVQTRMQLGAL